MDDFKNIWYADEGYSIAVSLSQFNRDEKTTSKKKNIHCVCG